MKYIDIHSHVQFAAYDIDRDEVIQRAREAETEMINVGTQKDTSKAAVELAHKHPDLCWATVGLHPIHTSQSFHDTKELGEGGKEFTSRGEIFDYDYYRDLGKDPNVLAIGECGLDYYRLDEKTAKKQKSEFEKQIQLANELGKPLMLHVRNGKGAGGGKAYDDALDMVKSLAKVKGDVHFFAGDWSTAKRFLDLGFTLSFTGVITFTNDYDEVLKNTPLDMILTETDAPYVTPVPYRGKRNEPMYVEYVCRRISEIKGMDFTEVSTTLLSNAKRVFGI